MSKTVPLDVIVADPRCQSRTGVQMALVREYAEAIEAGAEMPPLSAIEVAGSYYIYDGFHRIEAYRQAGVRQVAVEAEPGDVWDAIERSCRVNATHGQRRTNEDKHRAVETMLKVMEHRGEHWSNREIARRCAVSLDMVNRKVSERPVQIETPTTVTRNGTTYQMDTAKIGKRTAIIDLDTGEIDPGPDTSDDDLPEAEEVDPNDPASFLAPLPSSPRPIQPAPKLTRQRVGLGAVADRLATQLIREHGVSNTLEILDHLYEIVNERAAG